MALTAAALLLFSALAAALGTGYGLAGTAAQAGTYGNNTGKNGWFVGGDTNKEGYDSKINYDDLSEDDRESLRRYYTQGTLDQYLNTGSSWGDWWQSVTHPGLWGTHADWDRAQRDYEEYQRILDSLPQQPAMPDYPGLADAANQAIDSENARVLALYDQMLNRSNDVFQRELDASNASYNDYVNQTLTNNAMATNAIVGSTRYEMDRARRNAIRRGASAAQQLTASVNAQLGLQNRAAQQQLETSNQLASALLQQRQAASQLRGDYVNNLNADASRRADLISGTTERKSNLRNSYYDEARSRYASESEQYKQRLYGLLGDNPYAEVYKRKQSANPTTSTYGLDNRYA